MGDGTGTWETEVRLDGWCEGGLGTEERQQRLHYNAQKIEKEESYGPYVAE